MQTTSTSVHLDGSETVRVSEIANCDAFYVESGLSSVALVLPHYVSAADRIRFLDELAAQAAFLSTVIADREGVRAS